LGYAIFHLLGPDSELLSIATRASEQRKGIGSQLLKAGLDKLTESGDQCFLEVRDGNVKARAFYEKHGFKLYSVRKKYYSDGEDAALYKFCR
jgi:ribosomal-protein-alanine N-acetyltransferase